MPWESHPTGWEEVKAAYEGSLLNIEARPLTEYQTDGSRVHIGEVRATLASEGVAAADQLQ